MYFKYQSICQCAIIAAYLLPHGGRGLVSSPKLFDAPTKNPDPEKLGRVIVLNRPVFWAQAFAGLIVAAGIGVGIWAALARFDQQVVVTGKLEQQGAEKQISAPSAGAVEVQVHNGDMVTADQSLLKFKPVAPLVDVASLQQEKARLLAENQTYEQALKGYPVNNADPASLPKLRAELVQENQYYQALVTDRNLAASGDDVNQQRLLAASTPELQSQAVAARSQMQESEKQLHQGQEKLAAAQKLLALNQDILQQLTAQDVLVPRQQYQRQQQEVLSNQTTVDQLQVEQKRFTEAIAQARQQLQSTLALAAQNILNKVTQNQKRLTQIDAALRQAQQKNQTRIAEIEAELRAVQGPQEQQLRSPVAGAVFDIQPSAPGSIATANQHLLTIVPNDSWVASVLIKDQELGLVKPGMDVNVRITAWPNRELGSIQGKLVSVGASAVPPAATRPYYAFPAKIQLQQPFLEVSGQPMRLQSDMLVQGEMTLPGQQTVFDVMRQRLAKKVRVELSFN